MKRRPSPSSRRHGRSGPHRRGPPRARRGARAPRSRSAAAAARHRPGRVRSAFEDLDRVSRACDSAAAAKPAVPAPTTPTLILAITKAPNDHWPTTASMTSIRNLPLAVRLGGAFGALCVGLAIIAFGGIQSMGGVATTEGSLTTTSRPPRCSAPSGRAPRTTEPDLAAPVRRRRRPPGPGQDRRGTRRQRQARTRSMGRNSRSSSWAPRPSRSTRPTPEAAGWSTREARSPPRARNDERVAHDLRRAVSRSTFEKAGHVLLEETDRLAEQAVATRSARLRHARDHHRRADRDRARRPSRSGSPVRSCGRSRRSASA